MSFAFATFLHFFCISISAAVLALSTMSFGFLSAWVNSIIGVSALVYHITVLIANQFYGARTKKPWKRRSFLFNLSMKMPQDPLPSYSQHHRSVMVAHDDSGGPIPSGPFYSNPSLFSIVILIIIAFIGFMMTVDVLFRGVLSLPSGEREKVAASSLDVKVHKAQCTLLGVQILLWLVMLGLCVRGRNRIWEAEEEERDEFQLGDTYREPDELPTPLWNKGLV